MTPEKFSEIVSRRIAIVDMTLIQKAGEYADTKERLSNFYRAGQLLQCGPVKALAGMMAKHTISIYDMVQNPSTYPQEMWEEKLTDQIAYCILLEATLTDTLWRYRREFDEQ